MSYNVMQQLTTNTPMLTNVAKKELPRYTEFPCATTHMTITRVSGVAHSWLLEWAPHVNDFSRFFSLKVNLLEKGENP